MRLKIAIVSTVSQSPQALLRFCYYHLDLGVDHIFLYFDKPAENDIAALKEHKRITCISCNADHWARLNTTRSGVLQTRQFENNFHGIRLCRERGIDIVGLIDADEFLYANRDFKKTLGKVFLGKDLVYLYPYEAIHDKNSIESGPFEAKYFKVLPNRLNKHFAPFFYRRVISFTKNGFFGHVQGKPLIRVDARIKKYYQHRPILFDSSKMGPTNSLKLLHFDCASEDEWIEKWKKRFGPDSTVEHGTKWRGRQFEEIERALQGDPFQLRQLYRDYYYHGWCKLALGRSLGLLQLINVDIRDA